MVQNVAMQSLKQRSSLPSSFVTALVGWLGFSIITPLIFDYSGSVWPLLLVAIVSAILQTAILRLLFFPLQMDKGIWVGAICGGITGALIIFLESLFIPVVQQNFLMWLGNAVYIGIPVGGFLSYFYRDDKKIENEASSSAPGSAGILPAPTNESLDYGRDAHWLEPFGFGAVSYVIAFLPRDVDILVYTFIVGSITGVVAAGISHFSPDKFKRSIPIAVLLVIAGGLQGAVTGLLFRNLGTFMAPPVVLGFFAGFLTYGVTLIRGRSLMKAHSEQSVSS